MSEQVHFEKSVERRLEHPVTTLARIDGERAEAVIEAKKAWRVAAWEFGIIVVLAFTTVYLALELFFPGPPTSP